MLHSAFDVASENAMTAMGYDTGTFSPCLFHSSAVDMSVFRHGDDVVLYVNVLSTRLTHDPLS